MGKPLAVHLEIKLHHGEALSQLESNCCVQFGQRHCVLVTCSQLEKKALKTSTVQLQDFPSAQVTSRHCIVLMPSCTSTHYMSTHTSGEGRTCDAHSQEGPQLLLECFVMPLRPGVPQEEQEEQVSQQLSSAVRDGEQLVMSRCLETQSDFDVMLPESRLAFCFV